MGKQSARLYYRKKDHKDIYFQGNYHNAMYVRKDGDAELVWRKLYDDGYYVYTNMIQQGSYGTAILYPEYRIRESVSEYTLSTVHSNRYLTRKYAYSSAGAIISQDGKLWKRISGSTDERFVLPKGDGIVKVREVAYEQQSYEYIPCKGIETDDENAVTIYTDPADTYSGNSIYLSRGIADFCLLMDTNVYPRQAFAVDLNGNVYNGLFTLLGMDSESGGSGCFDGLYYMAVTNNRSYGGYVFVSEDIAGPWEMRTPPVKASDFYVIQGSDEIVVYLSSINDSMYSKPQIYTTKDFINYTRIDIQDSLCIPIIGPIHNGEKEYINLIFSYGTPELDDAYNYGINYGFFSYLSKMERNEICYMENGKISPPKGMIFQKEIWLANMQKAQITVYLDNLYFQESEGNFAFFEGLYPQSYRNDHMDKEETAGGGHREV